MQKALRLILCLLLLACPLAMAEDEALTLTDDIYDFRVSVDGSVYEVPFHVGELLDAGWTFDESETQTTLQPNHYTLVNYMVKDDLCLNVNLYNPDIVTRPFEDCYVVKLSFDTFYPLPDVELPKGINLTSTAEQVIEAYGEPTDLYESETAYYMTYNLDTRRELTVDYYDGELSEIGLYNFISTIEGVEYTPYDDQPTEVYNRFTPFEASDELFSHCFTLDGVTYSMLTPVQTFLDNGWEVVEANTYLEEGYIAATVRSYATLRKGNDKIDLYITNYDQNRAARVEYCLVTGIEFYADNLQCAVEIPGGFTLGMSADAVADTMAAYSITEFEEYSYYSYHEIYETEDDYYPYLEISTVNEENIVEEITLIYEPDYEQLPF